MSIADMMKRMMGGPRCDVCGFPIQGQGDLTWWNKRESSLTMCFQCCIDPEIQQHVADKANEQEDEEEVTEKCQTTSHSQKQTSCLKP